MKNKKDKQKVEEVVLGNKTRDVQINQRQHFLLYVSMLIMFNVLLISSAWFVLIYLTEWYYWVICLVIVGVCLGLSFRNYLNIKNFHKCELYENAVVIDSIWFNFKVDLIYICEINVKESFLDRMFKHNTKSLEIKILGHKRKHFTIHFIEENAVKLKQEITMLIDRHMSKNIEKVSD